MSKIAVVYWSGSGNTELMARMLSDGARSVDADIAVFTADKFSADLLGNYEKIDFGCPSMGDEVLEETIFEPMFASLEASLSGKMVALFGSYGWGDGQWMRDWEERCRKAGATVYNDTGLIICGAPEGEAGDQCVAFGKGFANC